MRGPILEVMPHRKRGRRKWRLAKAWVCKLPESGGEIVIPKGFVFDGASVPRLLWSFFNPTGELFLPSVVHDYAIQEGLVYRPSGKPVQISERQADALFWWLARDAGVGPVKAWLAWAGVRIGTLLRKRCRG